MCLVEFKPQVWMRVFSTLLPFVELCGPILCLCPHLPVWNVAVAFILVKSQSLWLAIWDWIHTCCNLVMSLQVFKQLHCLLS